MDDIEKEIETLNNKIYPLQNRVWKLYDKMAKQINNEFLESGILSTVKWRIRTYGNCFDIFIQYDSERNINDKEFRDKLEKICPYPHSHKELIKGMTLNQDDGDITITFDSPSLLLKYIKKYELEITEWQNMRMLIDKVSYYKKIEKYLILKVFDGNKNS